MGKQARLKKYRKQQAVEGLLLQDRILDLYTKIAPSVVYEECSVDCCLNATCVAIEVLNAFGIEAKPMTTKVLVFNPAMWARINDRTAPPSAEELREWATEGCWSLAIDGTNPMGRPGWPWHLVAVTKDRVIDSSSRQLARPGRNILMDDVIVAPISDGFKTGQARINLGNEHGVVMMYQAVPGNTEFRDLPGFRRHAWNLDMARDITQQIHSRLRADPG